MSRRDESHVSRDAAGVGPHVRSGVRLVPLGSLDRMKIADGEPDIRGWEVRMLSGTVIGRVSDLLVDADAGEVVMLDVDLAGMDRHSYAPIRAAQVDRARRIVMIDSAELHDASDVPSLARNEPLTDAEARSFAEGYARLYGARGWSRDEQRGDWRVRRGRDDLHFRRGAADLGAGTAGGTDADADIGMAAGAEHRRDVVLDRDVRDAAPGERGMFEGPADADGARPRDVRYAARDEERVAEQRPVVIEEVVVRRRVVDADTMRAEQADTAGGTAPGDRDRDGHVLDDRLRELRDDARREDLR